MDRGDRVAYLGPPGTNSEVAALRACPGAQLISYPTIPGVIRAVEHGEAERAVVAIENSLHGSVIDTVDLLVRETGVVVAGEIVLPIEHCLMVRPGESAADVRVIYSHPQSLGQCREYLEQHFPGVRTEAALSNAEAVEVMMRSEHAAALAPARAADLYGAEIIERDVQDARVNKTRFVVLAQDVPAPTGDDKTSIAFAVAHDRPGTLVSVLHEFSDRAINLTKIESRPSREDLGVYIFLVDLEGHRDDALVAHALAAVREQADFFRVLGSYPAWRD